MSTEAETAPRASRELAIALAVTGLAAVASWLAPPAHDATVVGAAFLGATWILVLRGDTATIREHGLALGGLLEPEKLDARRVARDAVDAVQWAAIAALVTWPLFVIAFPLWYGIER